MLGDFNEVMWQHEHLSKHRRPKQHMVDFREILSHCDLHDLGYRGLPWTFDNRQKGDRNVKVCLDRAVATQEWSQCFPSACVQHIVFSRSDHCPILLAVESDQNRKPKKIFRYEVMWEREPSLQDEIKGTRENVDQVDSLKDIQRGLFPMKESLSRWSAVKFGAVTKELRQIRERMECVSRQDSQTEQDELSCLRARMDEVLHREELMWLQRS
jgi:hypothetical protein